MPASMERSDHRWRTVWIGLLLAGVTIAVYWPALHHDFIDFDDPDYVTRNTEVQNGLSGSNLVWAFTTNHASNWHPVTWLSHMLVVQLFGLNPRYHHLTSVLLHAANALLLFLLLKRMTG